MADDNTEVEVDVRVRPLLGHWEPVGSKRQTKQYQEHLTSNGGLTTSVWKQSNQDEGLAVSVSQSFRYTGEEVGSRLATTRKADSKLQCMWEAPQLKTQSTDPSSSDTSYANVKNSFSMGTLSSGSICRPLGKVPSKTNSNYKGAPVYKESAMLTPPSARRRYTKKRMGRTSSRENKSGDNRSPAAMYPRKEAAKIVPPNKDPEEVTVSLSLPVKPEQLPGAAPAAPVATVVSTTVSEWKCWLMLGLFLALVCAYRSQLVAECPDE